MKGFIYITTNKINGKKYIGRKYYFDRNGKETNWKHYFGSSKDLKQDIKLYGKSNFERKIILECKTSEELAEKETELIKKYNAVKDPMFYNLSENTAKIYTTKEIVQKGINTRANWTLHKKQQAKQNLINAFNNMSEETKKLKSEKISKAHKNNPDFKKMRSEVQKKVWSSHSEEKKQELLKKRSDSNKQAWNQKSEEEKKTIIDIRKKWYTNLTEEQKKEHAEKIRAGRNVKPVTLYNIKIDKYFTLTPKEFFETHQISSAVVWALIKGKYSTSNTYKKTWTVK
jgi:hypothetical protein